VNIFATWAHPALLNLKDLIKLKKHYKKHRIEIVGLASDKNERNLESVREFAHILKINFDVIWESGDFAVSLVEAVSARAVIPQTFIIDTQGRIRKHFMGYSPTNTAQLLRGSVG
jgi:peroxiredoxin